MIFLIYYKNIFTYYIKWLKEDYPCDEYYRVRFLLLEPQGMIAPHSDMPDHKLSPVNIALNHPKKCIFKIKIRLIHLLL